MSFQMILAIWADVHEYLKGTLTIVSANLASKIEQINEFLFTLKLSKNLWFSNDFRGNRR